MSSATGEQFHKNESLAAKLPSQYPCAGNSQLTQVLSQEH